MPGIQQVDKAVLNSQQVCQAAEEQLRKVSRCTQQEGDARHSEQETGQRKANAHVQSGRKDNKEAIHAAQQMDRAVGSQWQAISWSRGNARQSGKGPRFWEDTTTGPAGRENKRVVNARQSPDRQGSKRPKPMNNPMRLSARSKRKPANRLTGQQGGSAFSVT